MAKKKIKVGSIVLVDIPGYNYTYVGVVKHLNQYECRIEVLNSCKKPAGVGIPITNWMWVSYRRATVLF